VAFFFIVCGALVATMFADLAGAARAANRTLVDVDTRRPQYFGTFDKLKAVADLVLHGEPGEVKTRLDEAAEALPKLNITRVFTGIGDLLDHTNAALAGYRSNQRVPITVTIPF
jgi:hypothetical protein